MRTPRVAYFPDSFHEVNGVAHTSRNFVTYAKRHELPFLCVRAGDAPPSCSGIVRTLDLPRNRTAVRLEEDLHFDPLFFRHAHAISQSLQTFRPDLIHITGPSELGIFGAYFAWKLGIPLAASWHTNVHEYAAKRMQWLTRHVHAARASSIENRVQATALGATSRFYRLASVLFAPNAELCSMLEQSTGKPAHLMQRGVDTDLFSPAHRSRSSTDQDLVLGYVGRLSVEKNVLLLPRIEQELADLGFPNVRFLIIGQGREEARLRAKLQRASFAGVLRGSELAQAYANMDVLVFPSHTDTFGNVVLEALASGVPAIVTPSGGPKYIVRNGETGFVTTDAGFSTQLARLLREPALLETMRLASRRYALGCSWDAVFTRIYAAYRTILAPAFQSTNDGSTDLSA
jgi:phosphatidylinositol alpha 1,6-mannosyltransferase